VQVKVEPKAKGWQQQPQQWWGGLQSPQFNVRFSRSKSYVFRTDLFSRCVQVVAVQLRAHAGGVAVVTCGKRFAYSIGKQAQCV
jgi:hypothetical protein